MNIHPEILSRQQLGQQDLLDLKRFADHCTANGDGFYLTMMKIYALGVIHGKQTERKKKHDRRS